MTSITLYCMDRQLPADVAKARSTLSASVYVRAVDEGLIAGYNSLSDIFFGMNIRLPEWVNSSWAFEAILAFTMILTVFLWWHLKRQN